MRTVCMYCAWTWTVTGMGSVCRLVGLFVSGLYVAYFRINLSRTFTVVLYNRRPFLNSRAQMPSKRGGWHCVAGTSWASQDCILPAWLERDTTSAPQPPHSWLVMLSVLDKMRDVVIYVSVTSSIWLEMICVGCWCRWRRSSESLSAACSPTLQSG